MRWSGVGDFVTAVLLAAVVKMVVLRYGGRKAYDKVLPFFLGLMLGDLVMGIGWIVIGIFLNIRTYVFFL